MRFAEVYPTDASRIQIDMQVIFFPSRNEYQDPAVTRRVMDMYKFMNSKVLFKKVRRWLPAPNQ